LKWMVRASAAGALRACCWRLLGDRPNEPGKLARNRGGDHRLQLPRMRELAISTTQSFLGFPRYVADRLAQRFLTQQEIATDPRRKPVAPRRLNQHAPCRAIARLGDPALTSCASTGMLGRNETQIGHELAGTGETGDVAEFRKDFAIAGGLFALAALGGGAWSLDALIGRRLMPVTARAQADAVPR